MVPAQKILDRARAENADIIGLSGPDHAVAGGNEPRRRARCSARASTMPLLIGGATTSRAHTALKIDPHYKSPTVWVKDASRAVGVAQSLISPANCARPSSPPTMRRLRRDPRAPPQSRRRQAPGVAGARRVRSGSTAAGHDYAPPAPRQPGITVFDDYPLGGAASTYIDWTPFFKTWELAGKYPAILDDAVVGAQARELFADAQAMLEADRRREVADRRRRWSACGRRNRVGDDVRPSTPTARPTTLHFLRQQVDKPVDRPDFCLADFIAPKAAGKQDWIGGFAVTAGIGIEPHVARFEADHDDYNAILLKALADRLAEALRRAPARSACAASSGATRPDEALDNEALIAEKYRGIRPAPGYPGLPRAQREGDAVRAARCARTNAGLQLTESFAMYPAAAVSGYYFSHPRQPVLRGRPRVDASRSRTTPSARAWRLRRPSAGWRRTWTTIRSKSSAACFGAFIRRLRMPDCRVFATASPSATPGSRASPAGRRRRDRSPVRQMAPAAVAIRYASRTARCARAGDGSPRVVAARCCRARATGSMRCRLAGMRPLRVRTGGARGSTDLPSPDRRRAPPKRR